MSDKALGLIETKGLVGAIEATDAAAKTAAVVVSSVELTEAAYMTLKIEGDLGAVQAAVEAGARAAEKVGELIAVHVIPNPAVGLEAILPQRRYISKYHPDDLRPPVKFVNDTSSAVKVKKTTLTKKPEPKKNKLTAMTVSELRQLARTIEYFPLKGREISIANKQQLIDAFNSIKDME